MLPTSLFLTCLVSPPSCLASGEASHLSLTLEGSVLVGHACRGNLLSCFILQALCTIPEKLSSRTLINFHHDTPTPTPFSFPPGSRKNEEFAGSCFNRSSPPLGSGVGAQVLDLLGRELDIYARAEAIFEAQLADCGITRNGSRLQVGWGRSHGELFPRYSCATRALSWQLRLLLAWAVASMAHTLSLTNLAMPVAPPPT